MAIQPITFTPSSTTPSNQPGNTSSSGIHPITFGNTPGASQPTPTPVSAPKTVVTPKVGQPLNFIQQAEKTVGNIANTVMKGITMALTPPSNPTPLKTPMAQTPTAIQGAPSASMKFQTPKVGEQLTTSTGAPAPLPGQTTISQAKKPTVWDNITTFFNNVTGQSPAENVARAQNAYSVAKSSQAQSTILKDFGVKGTLPNGSVNPDVLMQLAKPGGNLIGNSPMETISEQLGVSSMPTNSEFAQMLMTASVGLGLAEAPIATLKAIGIFSGVATVQTGLIRALTGGKGTTLSDLVPTDNPTIKNVVDVADFLALGVMTHGLMVKSPAVFDALTKDVITKYNLPQTVTIDSKDLLSLGNKQSNDAIKTLNLSTEELTNLRKAALKGESVTVQTPTSQITKLVDKPYWGKIKNMLNIPATDETLSTAQMGVGQKVTPIAGLLTSGEHTPTDVINAVFQAKAENTPEGKSVIQTSSEAQRQGQNIMITNETDFNNLTVTHNGERTMQEVQSQGLNLARNPSELTGKAVYFSDSTATSDNHGANVQATINTKDFNLKVIPTLADQQAYVKSMDAKDLADAIRKEGKYDGFIIPNPNKEVGNTVGITNLDKVNASVKGEIPTSQLLTDEGKQIVKEVSNMIYTGEPEMAKALHEAYVQDGNYLPSFDKIQGQIDQYREIQANQLGEIEKELQADQLLNEKSNPDDPTNQMLEIAGMLKKHFSAPGAKWKLTGNDRVYTSVEGYSMKVGGTYTDAVDRLFNATDIEGFKKNVKILADKFDKSFTEIYDRIRSGQIDGADYEQFKTRLNQENSHNKSILKNSIDAKSKADLTKASDSKNRESVQSSSKQGAITGEEVGNIDAGNVTNPNAITNGEPGSRAVGAESSNPSSVSLNDVETLFHGSASKFDTFDLSKIVRQEDLGGKGISFTTDRKLAEQYALGSDQTIRYNQYKPLRDKGYIYEAKANKPLFDVENIKSKELKIIDKKAQQFLYDEELPDWKANPPKTGEELWDKLIDHFDIGGASSVLEDLGFGGIKHSKEEIRIFNQKYLSQFVPKEFPETPLPSPTEESVPSQAQKEPVLPGGGVVEDKFMPGSSDQQISLEALKGTELENMEREVDWTGQEGFISIGAIDGGAIIKDIKATLEKAKANQEDKDFGTALRTYFVGERDVRIAETNQLILTAEKLVKLPVQQEALTFLRDFKNRPDELPMILAGTHPYYDAAVERFKKENLDATDKEVEDFAQKVLDRGAKLTKMIEQAAKPTEGMLKVDNAMNLYFKGRLEEGKKLGFLDSKITPEEYIPHLFVPPEDVTEEKPGGKDLYAKKNKIARYFKFAKGRAYKDVVEAYLNGVDPKTLNAFDSMAIYGDQHATVAATKLLIQQLKDTELGKWGSKKSEFIPSDWRPIAPESSLFQNEIPFVTQVNIADLEGAELAKWEKLLKDGQAKEIGDQYVKADVAHQSLYAPKKVVDALMPITDGDYMNKLPLFGKSRLYQAYIKSAELSLSIFHMRAMEITAASNQGLTGFMKSNLSDMNSPKFLDQEKNFIRAGGTSAILGRTIEAYSATRKTTVRTRIPTRSELMLMVPGLKQMNGFAHFLTYETFNVLQRKLKVTDFALKDAKWLSKHANATDAEHYTFQKAIAKEINAAYGGLQWEVLGVNKMTQSVLKLLLLAPDWTFSNWFNAKTAFQGGEGGAAARAFWVRAVIIGIVLNQLWSLLMSGHLSDDPTKAYLGTDNVGKKIYTNIGFAGAPSDMINLLKNIGDYGIEAGIFKSIASKQAPLMRTGTEMLTNRNYLGQAIIPKGSGVIVGTTRSAIELATGLSPIPFSIQNWFKMLTDPNGKYIPAEYISILLGGGTASHVIPAGERQVTSGVNKGNLVPASPPGAQRPFWEQVTTGKIYEPKVRSSSSKGSSSYSGYK